MRPTGTSGARISGIEIIDAGAGNDVVDLTSRLYDYGDVTILGGSGNDYLWSSAGNDMLYGGEGNDDLFGGAGNDTLYGDDGNDVIKGAQGNDTIDGGAGNDKLFGDDGDDVIYGGDGNDTVTGGTGADIIRGDAGNDKLNGNDGDDILHGGLGNDKLYGDAGDDILVVGLGKDKIYGGDGSDQIVYDVMDSLTDTIYGFQTGVGKDVLNLTDILQGYDPLTDAINDFVRFVTASGKTEVRVNADGAGTDFVKLAVFDTIISESVTTLIANGNLVLDQSANV
jgi:Ca2+-binding RTX toxin-like protein